MKLQNENNKQVFIDYLNKAIVLCSFSFGILSFILPIYIKNMGGSALSICGLFSIMSFLTLILRPFIGRIIDIYGRKKFLVLSFFFYGLSMLLFSFSTSISLIYMSRFIQAIGSSFMWVSTYSIIIDLSSSENRGSSLGHIDGSSNKGALYGAVIGFVILTFFPFIEGWNILFKIYALLCFVGGIIVYKNIPETLKDNNKNISSSKTITKKLKVKAKDISFDLYKLLIIVFIGSISSSMISPLLMIYLQDKFTTNITTLAYAFIPATLVYSFLPDKFGKVSDKTGRIRPIIIGLILSSLVSFCIAHVSSILPLVILWVLESVGVVIAGPAEEAFVSEISNDDAHGYAYGLYLFALSLGASIGPLIGGYLYDTFGHAIPFYLNGFILLFNSVLTYILFRAYKLYR